MRRSKRGKREVAVHYNKLGISFGEVREVGGKHGKAKFPGGNFAASVIPPGSFNVCFFPLEMFQGDGERWRQLGGKNLSFTTNSVQIVLSIAVLGYSGFFLLSVLETLHFYIVVRDKTYLFSSLPAGAKKQAFL